MPPLFYREVAKGEGSARTEREAAQLSPGYKLVVPADAGTPQGRW